ncbi:MAG: hypothetical protein ACLP3C_30665 [Mycobacterium sp.]|uniref:hypothetical protein n=1 Tax=Mycobacterium sp. TaxID=1785 RepID=UPI003F980D52
MPKGVGTPSPRKDVADARAYLGGVSSKRPANHPDVIQAREKLAQLNAVVRRDRAIDTLVKEWPELTHEQLARIVALFRAGRGGGPTEQSGDH